MAGAGAIRAGRAFIEFFGDDSKLNQVMTSIEGRLKSWGSSVSKVGASVSAAGALIEAPLVAASKLFATTSHEVTRLSEQTGMSAESIMAFSGAASRAGVGIEDVTTGVKKMQKSIFDAATGSQTAQQALRHLGLSASQLISMKPEDQFRLIAQRLAAIQNPAIRTGVAMEVMGKSAATLLPMMMHLQELEARGKRAGPGISNEDVRMGHELELSFMDLTSAMKKFTLQLGAAVAPAVKQVVDLIVAVVARANQWIKDNRDLVMTIFQIASVVVVVGSAIAAFGAALTGIAFVVGTVATALGVLASAVTFLMSPFGLALAAVVGLTYAFFNFTETGQLALAFITDAFTAFKDDAIAAFNGVRDALASGDIALAFKVLGTFLSLQWSKVVAFLSQKWAEFLNYMMPAAIEIAKRVANVFIDMSVSIAKTFIDMAQTLGKVLGKDLIDPVTATALKAGLPMLAMGAKLHAGAGLDALGGAIVSGADADARAALDNVAAARTQFDNAVATAKKQRKEFKAGEGGAGGLPEGFGDFGDKVKTAVSGTFSAAAAAGLAGSTELEKVADNTEEMKTTLKKINAKAPGIGVM